MSRPAPRVADEPASWAERVEMWVQEMRALLRRWHLLFIREPVHLVLALLQPAFWLVFFGGATNRIVDHRAVGTADYVTFILPGVIVFTIIGTAISGAVPLLWDKETGYFAMLMSMPLARSSVLLSRLVFQALVSTVQAVLILVAARVIGVRPHGQLVGLALVPLAAALLAAALTSLFLVLAYACPGHNTFFAVTGFVTLPLLLTSNAFVPLSAMPGWMAVVAHLNPVTYTIGSIRALLLDGWTTRLAGDFALLAAFTAACAAASYLALRRQAG
jgi:ABC-2 type transport system permease protein